MDALDAATSTKHLTLNLKIDTCSRRNRTSNKIRQTGNIREINVR